MTAVNWNPLAPVHVSGRYHCRLRVRPLFAHAFCENFRRKPLD